MISVLASTTDQPVAREFFELFKTPWRFYEPGSPVEILLATQGAIPDCEAKLVILFSSQTLALDGETTETKAGAAWFRQDGCELPIYTQFLADAAAPPAPDAASALGQKAQIVFRRSESRGRPLIRIGFDLFAEIRHLLTTGQPPENGAAPTLDRHIAFLRQLILGQGLPLLEIPPRPAGHEFIACLTHDVDHPGIRNHRFDHTMFGFLYRATAGSLLDVCTQRKSLGQFGQNLSAVLRLPLVHLGLARDFWLQFEQYTALEAGRPSTFYVIPKKGEPGLDARGRRMPRRAASYDAADLRDMLQQLESAGKEVTVHGLDAWRDSAAGQDERRRIGCLVKNPASGVRMHWLYFDADSPRKLEAAGFDYDSTMGYNSTVGYRAGTAQVFKPLAAGRLLELPMHIMDTALFYPSYLHLTPRQAEDVVRPLLDHAVDFGGALTVNWHDRSLAPERLWGDFYRRLIWQMEQRKAWFATAAQCVAWFRQRRAAAFETLPGGGITVKLPGPDTEVPPLRVRVYRPQTTVMDETLHDGWQTRLTCTGAQPAPEPARRTPLGVEC
jgi:hypothetical protein